jgi:hypothetical protein
MRCVSCDAELPEGALFCIECGTPAERASTGATERLPERTGGPRCPACGTVNPSFATYCVNCGRALGQEAGAPRPTLAPAPPRAAQPQVPHTFEVPALPSAQPIPVPPTIGRARKRRSSETAGGIIGGLFLIGLALLFATGTIWPGILVLVGITAFVGAATNGEARGGFIGAAFMVGMAFLFASDTFWPGILVLVGITAILGAVLKPGKKRKA